MGKWPVATFGLLLGLAVVWAHDPKQDYAALQKELQTAQAPAKKALEQARTTQDRAKATAELKKVAGDFAPRFFDFAEKNPTEPQAVDALVQVASNAGDAALQAKAFEALAKDHAASAKLAPLVTLLTRTPNQAAQPLLRAVLEKSKDKLAQGLAAYALAGQLKGKGEEQAAEAEALLERVVKEFASVKLDARPLGDVAKPELFQMKFLAIGKVAPDIEGEDVDGKKFKLSDYRGKVVVLDFWGHW